MEENHACSRITRCLSVYLCIATNNLFCEEHKRKWQRGENGRYKNTWRLLTLRSQPFLRLTEIYSTRVAEKLSGETTRPPIRNKSELTLGAPSRTKPIVRGPGGADFGVGMDRALPSVKYPYSLNHNSRRAFSFFLFLSKCHSFMSYKASRNHETRTAVIESRWRKRARAIREETRHPVLVTIAIWHLNNALVFLKKKKERENA